MTKKNLIENEDFLDQDDLDEASDTSKEEKHNKGTIKSTTKNKQKADHVDADEVQEDTDEDEDDLEEAYTSRTDLISKMVSYASKLPKDHLAQSVERIIHSAEEIAAKNKAETKGDDDSAGNKATIKSGGKPAEPMQKLSMREDIEAIFGSEELSEDFKDRTEALFEAAVQTRFNVARVELEEEFDNKLSEVEEEYNQALEEATEVMLEETEKNVDDYLTYAIKEWIAENEVSIRNNLKVEVTESFLQGLKGLFSEHYVEIPDDKLDVVESLSERVEELENSLNEQTERNIKLTKDIQEQEVAMITSELTEGMTDTEKEKFVDLVENISYSNTEEFKKKAGYILESHVKTEKAPKMLSEESDLDEEVEDIQESEEKKFVDPRMKSYAQALKFTARR